MSGLSFDEPGQLGAGAGRGVGDEVGRVLLHQTVQRGLLGAVALVVERARVGGPRKIPRGQAAGGRSTWSGCGAVWERTASLGSPGLPTPAWITPMGDADGGCAATGVPA